MTTQSTKPASLTEFVAAKRERGADALVAAGVLTLVLTIFWVIRWQSARDQPAPPTDETAQQAPADEKKPEAKPAERGDSLPAAIWSGLLTVLFLLSAGWQLTHKPEPNELIPEIRRWLIALGG